MPEPVPWSPYDAAVPHTVGLADAQRVFAALRPRRLPPVDDPLGAVREVVAVVSSSRGGSTLFGEILRRCGDLLHLRAEVNPQVVVAGLGGEGDTAIFRDELAAQIGTAAPADAIDGEVLDDFALAVAWRLTAQWPALGIDVDDVIGWVDHAAVTADRRDHLELHLRVLEQARSRHPGINPHYYDLPAELVDARFPDAPTPCGPPGDLLVEMPPFVLVRPWRRAGPADLADRPLVLSTPRNAFRLGFLRALFPNARFRVIHLTRNPAASVNGLIDGWLHHGFFNVAVAERLRIAGYSDACPGWGGRWWCYDFPPAWREWTSRSLPEVCGEQWRSHHAAVLEFLAAHPDVDARRVRFEDVVGPEREGLFADLGRWLGVGDALAEAAGEELPPVMATAPPRPRRWLPRAEVVEPVVAAPELSALADELGYAEPATWD